jgi:hypothetical protein
MKARQERNSLAGPNYSLPQGKSSRAKRSQREPSLRTRSVTALRAAMQTMHSDRSVSSAAGTCHRRAQRRVNSLSLTVRVCQGLPVPAAGTQPQKPATPTARRGFSGA